jgi:hypothetical protein
MEKQTLPNSTLILVFGIVSIVTCCCYGVLGLIFGIIALVLAKNATALYLENPEIYSGYNNVKAGKTLSIIGIVLNGIYLILTIYIYIFIGMDAYQEFIKEIILEAQGG